MFRILRLAVNISASKATVLASAETSLTVRRWAGHSKWANIKHQKTANDVERNKLFTRLSRMIRVAITEGKDPNPDTNSRLQSVLGQCKRANMPQSSIVNTIKSAVSAKSDEKTSILEIRGPGRCALLVEVATATLPRLKNYVSSVMKKHGCKYDNVGYDFTEKGVLIASPLAGSDSPLDDATEHAIEASVEDVTFDQETGKLRFECSPEATWKAKKALEGLGYVLESVVIEYLPANFAELTDEQLEMVSTFVAKMEAMPETMKITDNIQ